MKLESEYAGDSAWNRFLEAHRNSPMSGETFDASVDDDYGLTSSRATEFLDVAISYFGRAHIESWIRNELEILDGESPLACMRNPKLHQRLQVYMMQLPC